MAGLASLAGGPGPALGREPAVVATTPSGPAEVSGWTIGVVNTADARGEILPCT